MAGNLLPYNEFNKIFPDVSIKDLHRSIDPDVTLEAYNGSCINQLGTCKLNVNGASKELCQAIFFVVPDYCRPILGLQSCIDLDLIDIKCPTTEKWNLGATIPQPESGNVNIKVDSIKSETDHKISKDNITQDKCFKHLFRGIGKFPVKPVDLEINPEIDPFQTPPCRVPVAMKDKFDAEIKQMVDDGIISKLDTSTGKAPEWLSSFVAVKKPNGSLQICLDLQPLNAALCRPVYNSKTLSEVEHLLKDAKYFSVFNTNKAFFHVPLSDKSKLLTAMLTLVGIYVYNCLAMGLCISTDVFKSIISDLFQLDGVTNNVQMISWCMDEPKKSMIGTC